MSVTDSLLAFSLAALLLTLTPGPGNWFIKGMLGNLLKRTSAQQQKPAYRKSALPAEVIEPLCGLAQCRHSQISRREKQRHLPEQVAESIISGWF